MPAPAVVYRKIPDLDAFENIACASVEAATTRKELIYVGNFTKTVGSDEQNIRVTKDVLDHWHATGNAMLAKGIAIPLPAEHTTDPEKRRGSIRQLERGLDSKGREALFGYIEWRTPEDAVTFKASDVSIFVPPEFIDTEKTVWKHPIRHVALTDYPVIPDLDGFQTIAASFTLSEPSTMNFIEYAKSLGLNVPDGASEDDAKKMIADAVKAGITASKPKEDPPKPEDKPAPQPIAASLVSMACNARKSQIDSLLTARKITPAVAKELTDKYTSSEKVVIALSNTTSSDGFDEVVAMLSHNAPQGPDTKEKSGPQVIKLSHEEIRDKGKNPLLANAAARKN